MPAIPRPTILAPAGWFAYLSGCLQSSYRQWHDGDEGGGSGCGGGGEWPSEIGRLGGRRGALGQLACLGIFAKTKTPSFPRTTTTLKEHRLGLARDSYKY
jgi:hypothetical protein